VEAERRRLANLRITPDQINLIDKTTKELGIDAYTINSRRSV
jgi:hypothetical protein